MTKSTSHVEQQLPDDDQADEPHDHRASVRTTDGSAADNPSAANDTEGEAR